MNARSCLLLVCGCSGLLLCADGSQRGSLQAAPVDAAPVSVSRPIAREVTDYVDLAGRTEAVNLVNVVARATGYLVKEPFKEGSDVKTGDLLFEIDPRPYQAQCDLALSQVNVYGAQLKLAQATLARDEQAARTTPGAIGVQQLDQDHAAVDQAMAQVKVAEAGLETHRLNLAFCKVLSPIDGQVSRYNLTLGNLVTQDRTLLTTIVSHDPVYAYVDLDESTMLRVLPTINEERTKPYGAVRVPIRYGAVPVPILMGLPSEEGFPHEGIVNFVDNQVNSTTGTVLLRGVFSNPLRHDGHRLLMPGMFVRVRLPIGQPHPALLVTERAICSDQGLKYVYVVDAQSEIEYRRVETGPLESDGLRAITKGLNANDQVVVNSLRQVRPGVKVQTQVVPMPVPVGRDAERSKRRATALPAGPFSEGVPAAGANQPSGAGNQETPKK